MTILHWPDSLTRDALARAWHRVADLEIAVEDARADFVECLAASDWDLDAAAIDAADHLLTTRHAQLTAARAHYHRLIGPTGDPAA